LQAEVASRDEQLEKQQRQIHELELERRRLHNINQELKGNIRVLCRVRPLLPEERERQKGLELFQFPPEDKSTLVFSKPEGGARGGLRYSFSFDRVFPPEASQREVYEEIALLVQVWDTSPPI
ncbi:CTK2 protein, partial [Thinocorus orbignyianus]|nr:CTK2 protein [Thinocorus orbignyianus]